jgi:hypothetical protein
LLRVSSDSGGEGERDGDDVGAHAADSTPHVAPFSGASSI